MSRRLAICLLLIVLLPGASRAQLATSFYNVTGIETRVLPNAVQVIIRTDGAVALGGDFGDFFDTSNNGNFQTKTLTSFRMRLFHARARLPAFVDIGKYPVDSAAVALGTDTFKFPFSDEDDSGNGGGPSPSNDPRVDITLRFFVPIRVTKFGRNLDFGSSLNPRDVTVALSDDRRSVLVTVVSDRTDNNRAASIHRSPPELQHHRLSVTPAGNGLRVEALHAPLSELLQAVAQAARLSLTTREDAQDVDVSLLLPSATPDEFLRALSTGYGLIVTPIDGGGRSVGRGGTPSVLERLPLRNLAPEAARLLFPNFLLPSLRADIENNALLVSGPPALAARLRRDLTILDTPRPQVRVAVDVWELTDTQDDSAALQIVRTLTGERETIDGANGQVSVLLRRGQTKELNLALTALRSAGRARLKASPSILVASGARGTLFLGQSRYVTVIQNGFIGPQATAITLPVGYSLTVQPQIGAEDDITLDLSPRVSTVDAVERGTGLPTLGIREISATVRVRPGEAVLVSGLDSTLAQNERRRVPIFSRLPLIGPLFSGHTRSRAQTALLVLVNAARV